MLGEVTRADRLDEEEKLESPVSKHSLSDLVKIYSSLKDKVLNKTKEHDRNKTISER